MSSVLTAGARRLGAEYGDLGAGAKTARGGGTRLASEQRRKVVARLAPAAERFVEDVERERLTERTVDVTSRASD